MKSKYLLLFLLITPLFSFTEHKYYLSLTQIKFNEKSSAVQVIINVFMDDIELALNKDYNIDLRLTTEKELKNNDQYFKDYLEKKLSFTIDGVEKNYNYIGKQYENDLVLFYLEIENIEKINSIGIENNVLTRHFPDQQNLIKSKVGEKNKSVLLDKEKNTATLNFNN